MDEDESNTSSSSFSGSPSMNPAFANLNGAFDINYLLSLANPDLSSSSSESQSQGSRGQSPSDWADLSAMSEQQPPMDPSWKWDPDQLLSSGIDPNALILGAEMPYEQSSYPPALQAFHFEQPIPPRETIQPPVQYIIPEIIEPPQSSIYRPQQQQSSQSQQQQKPLHQPQLHQALYIHAPQPQHVIAPPPLRSTGSSNAMDADAIGRRARELAGVEYAVTAAQHAETMRLQQPLALPQLLNNMNNGMQQAQHYPPQSSLSPSPSSASSGTSPSANANYEGKNSRTKTSHTTIERRYRTNLNARIVALRHAVPALRILERDKFPDEKIDERGYVDGVKAARKASKGSILGKAADYIGVLKRREVRLRRDYDGLRTLIHGLVGGPELLNHWERAWREQNGGEELDYASDGDADEEDGSDDEDDKPKKKAKVAPTPVAKPPGSVAIPSIPGAMGGAQPDLKRKRGRPRKNPLPVAVPAPPPMFLAQQQHQQQVQQQSGKYLLGIFLLFSFLNPSSSPSHSEAPSSFPHKHVGTVLTALNSTVFQHPASQYVASYAPSEGIFSLSWGTLVQYAHGIITFLLFLSVARSIVPESWARALSRSSSREPEPASVDLKTALEKDDRESLARALKSKNIGVFCAASTASRSLVGSVLRGLGFQAAKYDPTTRAAIVRLAELDLMQRAPLSVSRRIHHTFRVSQMLVTSPSTAELTTLAVLAHPLAGNIAANAWAKVQSMPTSSDKKFLMERTLEDAVQLYNSGHAILGARAGATGNGTEDGRITPLGLIASGYVCEKIKDAASELFAKESPPSIESDTPAQVHVAYAGEPPSSLSSTSLADTDAAAESTLKSSEELEDVISLGRSLTKPVRDLTNLLEDVAAGLQPVSHGVSFMLPEDDDEDGNGERDALSDATSFLEAILLYRRIALSSPPSPSPSETSTLFAADSLEFSSSSETSRASSAGPGTPTELELVGFDGDDSASVLVGPGSSTSVAQAKRTTVPLGKASVGSRLALRRILGSNTFAAPLEVEDARNRMVDYLVDTVW